VFRTDGLDEAEIWDHARRHALPPGRNLHGRADMREVAVVAATPLEVEHDNSPPRHANIIGWPLDRAEQVALAQDLAATAHSLPPPTE